MSVKKQSRNQQRKTAYAAMADKSSRNQDVLTAPVVGRLETVTTETRPIFGGTDEDTGLPRIVGWRDVEVRPYQRVVHDIDTPKAAAPTRAPKRATDARKVRRQIGAWGRCRVARETGAHDIPGANCRCCGCPAGAATTATAA